MALQKLVKIFSLVVLGVFLIAACNRGAKTSVPLKLIPKAQIVANVGNIITHQFSDVAHPDTFKLVVQGGNLLNAKITFKIVNYKGKQLYSEVFNSTDLIGYGLEPDSIKSAPPSNTQQEAYIRKRIKEFFTEENFTKPAIVKNMPFDEDYSDKVVWKDIGSDRTAVGFNYLLGEEDGKSIAYSKKHRKVVLYFSCC
jgi:hypothetical protein